MKKKKPGPAKKKVESVRCVCSSTVDSGHMVECERCKMWCHSKCVGVAHFLLSVPSVLRLSSLCLIALIILYSIRPRRY